MQSDLFNCSVCRDPFNSTDHLPKIMPICGKTLCEACLKGIVGKNKMCPLCNKTLPKNSQDSSRYLTNDILVQIIEDRRKNEAGRCMKHDKPGDLACITDRCLICRQCTIEHQGHKVRPVDEVKSEAQDKKNKLRSLLLDLGEQRTDVLEKKTYLTYSEAWAISSLRQEFKKLKNKVQKKEEELCFEVESFYKKRKMEADEILEENSIIGRKCEIKTADLDQQINLRFFDTLERLDREFPSVPRKTSLDQIFGSDYDAKEKISSYLQAFSQGVMTLLQQDNFEINAHLKTNLKVEESTFGSQEEDEEMDKESLSQLFQLQVEGNALRAIPLDFGNSNNANKQSFPDISHLKQVEFFHIGSKNVHFTEKHSDFLKHLHSKCNQIWKLYFCLKSNEFTDEDLTHFCSDFFWATYKIRTFSFNLKNTKVSDIGVVNLLNNSLVKMPEISSFYINMAKTKITDQSTLALASQIAKNMTKIVHINLDLKKTNLTDVAIKELCKSLRPIAKKLKSFGLGLTETGVTDQGMIAISRDVIALMNDIENFELYLSKTELSDEGFKCFCQNAQNSFRRAKSFTLSMTETRVSDKSLSIFATQVLPKMLALKSFKLSLHDTGITDKSMHEASESFKSILQNLGSFTLHVCKTKITDKSIQIILDLIDLASMKDLCSFNFLYPPTSRRQIEDKHNLLRSQLNDRCFITL